MRDMLQTLTVKYFSWTMFAFLAVSLLLSVVFGATDDPVVVVIGDSWGSYGHDDLQKVLKEKGSNLTGIVLCHHSISCMFYDNTFVTNYHSQIICSWWYDDSMVGEKAGDGQQVGVRESDRGIYVDIHWRQ